MEVVFTEEEFRHHSFLRLEPYSPMLNPIEMVWSVLIIYVKRRLEENRQELLTRDEGETLIGKRNRLLQHYMKVTPAVQNSVGQA